MSRDYEEFCNRCEKFEARKGFLDSGYYLYQCLNCGMCWLQTCSNTELKTSGKNTEDKTWETAMEEAYNLIHNRRE